MAADLSAELLPEAELLAAAVMIGHVAASIFVVGRPDGLVGEDLLDGSTAEAVVDD